MDSSQKLPRIQSYHTPQGRPKTSVSNPRKKLPLVFPSQNTLERLSTPKGEHPRFLPDRPSIYYLDYLIDDTPQKIKDPKKLASYYENFEPKFPRTRLLSAPKTYPPRTLGSEEELNVPLSALSYEATERIKDLARPRTALLTSSPMKTEKELDAINNNANNANRPAFRFGLLPVPIRTLSLTPNQKQLNTLKEPPRSSGPQRHRDFSRGDFSSSSTTKLNLPELGSINSKRGSMRTARSSEDNTNRNIRKVPPSRSRFSMKL